MVVEVSHNVTLQCILHSPDDTHTGFCSNNVYTVGVIVHIICHATTSVESSNSANVVCSG